MVYFEKCGNGNKSSRSDWRRSSLFCNKYQFVYFEALDRDISNEEEKQPVYCFYDDENMQKSNVMDALNKAVRFCSAYKIT